MEPVDPRGAGHDVQPGPIAPTDRTVHLLDERGTVRDWLVSPAWTAPCDDLGALVEATGSPWGPEGRWVLTNGPEVARLKERLSERRPLVTDQPLPNVAENAPLIVEDARVHPVLHDNGSVHDYGVIGYLGFPLHIASGKTLGSFCAVDTTPHRWTNDEINIMRELAEIVTYEIELRALAVKGDITMEELERTHQNIIGFTQTVRTDLPKAKIAEYIRTERQRLFPRL